MITPTTGVMTHKERLLMSIPGKETTDVVDPRGPLAHLWMGNMPMRSSHEAGEPLVLERGSGIYLWDTDGNRYIDAIASLEAVAIGHGRPEIREAVVTQYQKLEFFDTLRSTSPTTLNLARRLVDLLPGSINRVHFATSGSEAVESALKAARQYHHLRGEPGRFKVISRRGAYHGCTYGAMALDGNYYRTRRELFEPLPPIGRFVSSPISATEIIELIEFERPETISAVVVDPMATASGIYAPEPGFWKSLREACDKYGVLLIADEVITAFGRTGRWFASSQDGVHPDMITMSKGLSSGYFPISAMAASTSVTDVFDAADVGFSHGHTFGGHPVAAAAALANLEVIENETLVNRARDLGPLFQSELQAIVEEGLAVEARGEGLLWGLQLEHSGNRSGGTRGKRVISKLRELGVLTFVLHPGDVLFLCPPLVISDEEVGDLISRVRSALRLCPNAE
jgi:adenosylmethionine-8-amino-7-oxononanoate aminotransferase